MPLKIIYFITELSTGGAQIVLLNLLMHINRNRFEPIVVCLYNGDGVPAQRIRALGIPVIDLGMTGKLRLDALWRLYKVFRKTRPIILHTWMFHANVLGRIVGKLAGIPIIITSRHSIRIGGKWRELIKSWTVGLDDKIIAVCEMARQLEIEYAKSPPEKVITIHNGIDWLKFAVANPQTSIAIRQSFNIPPNAPLIGAIGRLSPAKGYSILLQAMSKIHQQIPTLRLLLVGDGELRTELETLTRQLNLSEYVIFTGTRSNIPEILHTLDIFVLSSLWEGLPNTILEAMSAGIPVVATSVGGVPEVITHLENGWLVSQNNVDDLAEAIIHLLRSSDLRHQLGHKGQERVKNAFNIIANVNQTQQIYQQLLDQKLVSPPTSKKG